MIDKQFFYQRIRDVKLFATLTQEQVNSMDAILSECEKQKVSINQAAYIFATAYHECFNPRTPQTRLTPIVEFGGDSYLRSKKYYPYYGRGFSQLTWDYNYKKEGIRLGLDLIKSPELILDIPIAANSHVYCMMNGIYTGRKLSNYIHDDLTDYVNARRVVNGTDKATLIASYAQKFEQCLKLVGKDSSL